MNWGEIRDGFTLTFLDIHVKYVLDLIYYLIAQYGTITVF